MAKYVITKHETTQFRFHLVSDGTIILTSETYKDKSGCKAAIAAVQLNSQFDRSYRRKTSITGRLYFILVAGNEETIGTSEMYSTELARELGILGVKSNGLTYEIEDRP